MLLVAMVMFPKNTSPYQRTISVLYIFNSSTTLAYLFFHAEARDNEGEKDLRDDLVKGCEEGRINGFDEGSEEGWKVGKLDG